MCTGKCVLCLEAHGTCNQLQDNCINYEFNYDFDILSLMQGSISRGLLSWKQEMHLTLEN